jgi:hypothetical protein
MEFILLQCEMLKVYRATRSRARVAMLFPRGSDDQLAYMLLEVAKQAISEWITLSFWRTSRTTGTLERIAGHWNHPDARNERIAIPDPSVLKNRYIWDDPLDKGRAARFPAFLLAFRSDEPDPNKEAARGLYGSLSRLLGGTTTREPLCSMEIPPPNGDSAPLALYWAKEKQHTEDVQEKIGRFLAAHTVESGCCMVALSCSQNYEDYGHRDWDPWKRVPGPFEVILAVTAPLESLLRCVDSLDSIRHHLDQSAVHFDLVSVARLHLRSLTSLLDAIGRAQSTADLAARLEDGLHACLGVDAFALLRHGDSRIVLTSSRLSSFEGALVRLPDIQNQGLVSIPKLAAETDATLVQMADHLRGVVLNEFRDFQAQPPQQYARSREFVESLQLSPDCREVGFAGVTIDAGHSLLVFQGRTWKLRALEEMILRLAAVGLQSAIPLIEQSDTAQAHPRVDDDAFLSLWADRNDHPRLVSEKAVDWLLRNVPGANAMIVAVDRHGRFFRRLTRSRQPGENASKVLPMDEESLISLCCKEKQTLSASIDQEGHLMCRGRQLKYFSMLAVQRTVVAMPLGHTHNSEPLAALVVALPQPDHKSRLLVERLAERTSILLSAYQQEEIRKVSSALESDFGRLRIAINEPLTLHLSEIRKDSANLPPALKRCFNRSYRELVTAILSKTSTFTGVGSLTLRLYDESLDDARIWCLAHAAPKGTPDFYPFGPDKNVHSYCMVHRGAGEPVAAYGDPSADRSTAVSCWSAFLPDASEGELCDRLYPGVRYRRVRQDTEAELCIPVVSSDGRLRLTLNIEDRKFEELWVYEEFFERLARDIGWEIFARYAQAQISDRSVVRLASEYSSRLGHDLARAGLTLTSQIEHACSLVPPEGGAGVAIRELLQDAKTLSDELSATLSQQSGPSPTANPTLIDVVREAIRRTRESPELRSAKHVELDADPSWVGRSLPMFGRPQYPTHLLHRVLVEQVKSLERIAIGSMIQKDERYSLRTGIRDSGHDWMIDIFSTAPSNAAAKELAQYLFWYYIDEGRKEGDRGSGSGLMILGTMLRGVGVYPRAHPELPADLLALYGAQCTGIWLELVIREVQ